MATASSVLQDHTVQDHEKSEGGPDEHWQRALMALRSQHNREKRLRNKYVETIKKIVLGNLIFCYGVRGTPGSLLDLPRHFLGHFEDFKKFGKNAPKDLF